MTTTTSLVTSLLCVTLLITKTMADYSEAGLDFYGDAFMDPTTADPGLSVARAAEVKALGWVMGQMDRDYGWGQDTAHTTLAVALTNASWALDPSNLEAQLMSKQFELELVLRLWKHKEVPLSSGHLALNILALVALCRDPRAFHGKNLVSMLEHQEGGVHFEKAFSMLAACSAGKKIHRRNIRELLSIIESEERVHSIDTLSVVVLALQCAQKHRNRDLGRYIEEAMTELLRSQQDDGSFNSNLHSTALGLQAMISSSLGGSWNATLSQQYLMAHQRADGSFGGLFDTNAVMPLLVGRTLLGVMDQPCLMQPQHRNSDGVMWQYMDSNVAEEPPLEAIMLEGDDDVSIPEALLHPQATPPDPPKLVNFTYIIWIGNKADLNFNLSMSVPENTTFYDIMQMAAERDHRFEFGAKKFSTGYYIHTISGQEEKMAGYWFWLLYRLSEPPVPGTKPDNSFVNPTGVLETYPKDGEYMLFWYHKI